MTATRTTAETQTVTFQNENSAFGDGGDDNGEHSGGRVACSQKQPVGTDILWEWRAMDAVFDQVVMTLAARAWPRGYSAAPVAPDSLEALNALVASGARMVVWGGASGATIYGSPKVNYAFRAWHDWHHWKHQEPFTFVGEAAVAYAQVKELEELVKTHPEARKWCAMVYAEVAGQAMFAELNHGKFPANQRLFVKRFIEPLLDGES